MGWPSFQKSLELEIKRWGDLGCHDTFTNGLNKKVPKNVTQFTKSNLATQYKKNKEMKKMNMGEQKQARACI
jgi:hypothetical protein